MIRVLIIIALLAVASMAQSSTRDLPKQIGLTEVQRLKEENYQLKIQRLQEQLAALTTQRTELLKGVLKGAGIEEADFVRYQYDPNNFYFTLLPEKKDP